MSEGGPASLRLGPGNLANSRAQHHAPPLRGGLSRVYRGEPNLATPAGVANRANGRNRTKGRDRRAPGAPPTQRPPLLTPLPRGARTPAAGLRRGQPYLSGPGTLANVAAVLLHPAVRDRVERVRADASQKAWPAIATGEHVLISAPPLGDARGVPWGSTTCREPAAHTRLVYGPPLKALSPTTSIATCARARGSGPTYRWRSAPATRPSASGSRCAARRRTSSSRRPIHRSSSTIHAVASTGAARTWRHARAPVRFTTATCRIGPSATQNPL